jgi:hypothetical protein
LWKNDVFGPKISIYLHESNVYDQKLHESNIYYPKKKKEGYNFEEKVFFERKKQVVYFFRAKHGFPYKKPWEHTLVGLCLGETNFYFKFMKISL